MPKNKKEQKPIGTVTHFYGNLSVAIVKFSKKVEVGTKVHFKGATTDLEEAIKSMQYDHKGIASAKKGQEVGIKVDGKVREGDLVYLLA
ncbi:MAG: translation elongation factor-like protein [Patescibacteria group bacterium]|nr:translation elongation factor-like protein [Patescibacteria group bacterium]MDE2015123.1 translation elongation factor-like protein [Patescibacteria group bacterium]MDE2226551.1 translation elongation factor-like protein [Patescibacteria group bacterium]